MTTDRKNTPISAPGQYRQATLQDILDPNVPGFYDDTGAYWRKNGKVKTWKTRPTHAEVPVKFGLRDYDYISHENIHLVYVRLSYIYGNMIINNEKKEEKMCKKLICPHCGGSNFDEKILQEIFVPYIWDEITGEYQEQKEQQGEAETEGLYCAKCERDTPFVWLDMGIGEIK